MLGRPIVNAWTKTNATSGSGFPAVFQAASAGLIVTCFPMEQAIREFDKPNASHGVFYILYY